MVAAWPNIYFEGDTSLKSGLSQFFAELRLLARRQRCEFHLIAAGDGSRACRDYGLALKNHSTACNILLIDSEGPLNASAAADLCKDHGWNHATGAAIFWMVEMMEAWFHADKDALEKFYGQGFNRNALKPNPRVEKIAKHDIREGLANATRKSKPGNYFDHKTMHGPKLLELIDPNLVKSASPQCEKLFATVLAELG